MADGFGFSFYGFFVVAALWCVVYFLWAVRANRRERRPDGFRRSRDDGR